MLNYVKSELYRAAHSPGLYGAGLCFAAAPLLVNLILFWMNLREPGYRYSTTSFSYSNLVANPMFFCVSALFVVYVLYEGYKRNGNLKNAAACGISSQKIFAGQVAVCLIVSLLIMAVTLAVYMASANLLLRQEGAVRETHLIGEVLAVFPTAVAALILAVAAVFLFDKASVGLLCWFGVLYGVPMVLFYLGMELEPVREAAMWMPRNFFTGMEVNMQACAPIWDTAQGMARCLISGFAGIIVFSVFGLLALGKKEF